MTAVATWLGTDGLGYPLHCLSHQAATDSQDQYPSPDRGGYRRQ